MIIHQKIILDDLWLHSVKFSHSERLDKIEKKGYLIAKSTNLCEIVKDKQSTWKPLLYQIIWQQTSIGENTAHV